MKLVAYCSESRVVTAWRVGCSNERLLPHVQPVGLNRARKHFVVARSDSAGEPLRLLKWATRPGRGFHSHREHVDVAVSRFEDMIPDQVGCGASP